MAKGAAYEREVCKILSLWWTQDDEEPSDFVFWRSSQSGGMATSRAKRGKKTHGHCGDTFATSEVGRPFAELVTVEIKRGYNDATILDAIDFTGTIGIKSHQRGPDFLNQAAAAAERAGTPYWWVVHRRDKRRTLLWMPRAMFDPLPNVRLLDRVRLINDDWDVIVVPFEGFLDAVSPKDLVKAFREKR